MPYALMPDWNDEDWKPFRDAWDERGLAYPPSAKQRRLVWPVVRDYPDLVATWVEEAPHETNGTYEIVAYVRERCAWERGRAVQFNELTDEERREWFGLEEGEAHHTTIPEKLRLARETGGGLPVVRAGVNAYRVFLRQMADAMAEWLEMIERMQQRRREEEETR